MRARCSAQEARPVEQPGLPSRFGSVDQPLDDQQSGQGHGLALPGNLPGLNAPFAAIPDDTAGPITQLNEFRAGETNYRACSSTSRSSPKTARTSAVANAHVNVTPNVDRRRGADGRRSSRRFETTPSSVAAVVPGTNPYNNFRLPVMVTEFLAGTDPTQHFRFALDRGVASLRAGRKPGIRGASAPA